PIIPTRPASRDPATVGGACLAPAILGRCADSTRHSAPTRLPHPLR
ncbi:unnamed protein product, partial [marine sediment metagenome]